MEMSSILTALMISMVASASKSIVIVSGAGGKTGSALFQQSIQDGTFRTIGLVRTQDSKDRLLAKLPGVTADDVAIVDVTDGKAVQSFVSSIETPIRAFCIATSATPVPTGTDSDGRPVFAFPNGEPELVDWIGQKNQIDACPAGTHVIVCSTMGGTNPSHPLNRIGRKDGTGGMIVQYKRKAEQYLIAQDRLKFTIIHPSGLTDNPGRQREIIFGVDDETDGESSSIPRDDVARIMYSAVLHPEVFTGRSFDARSKEGTPTDDLVSLIEALKKNCDYSLGEISV